MVLKSLGLAMTVSAFSAGVDQMLLIFIFPF